MAGTFQSAVLCRHAQNGIRDQRCRSAAGSPREEGRLPRGFSASVFPEAAPAPCLAALHLRWQSLKVREEGRSFLLRQSCESGGVFDPIDDAALVKAQPKKGGRYVGEFRLHSVDVRCPGGRRLGHLPGQ
jgi:hypothetical protein